MRLRRGTLILAALLTLLGGTTAIAGTAMMPTAAAISTPATPEPGPAVAIDAKVGPVEAKVTVGRPWSAPPAHVDPKLWGPAKRPPGAPSGPAPMRPAPRGGESVVNACYPPGTNGYEPGPAYCTNPGYYNNGIHWGDEPYYGSGIRYVWIRDAHTDQRTREWLHYWVNVQNQNYVNSGNTNGLAYVLEQAENLGGGPRGTCMASKVQQWIDVCPTGGNTSSAAFGWVGTHLTGVTVRLALGNVGNEYRTQNSVYHELGHAIGFAHDTNCNSVMTYCSTYGTRYLDYSTDQVNVVYAIYVNHTN